MRRVGPAQHQSGQRQQPALAAVVGPHDDDDVFDHDDQHQGPNDERERAENGVLAHIGKIDQRLPNGVERGSADVAEYDAKRGERQARTSAEAKVVPPCGAIEHQGKNFVRLKVAKTARPNPGGEKNGLPTGSVAESFSLSPDTRPMHPLTNSRDGIKNRGGSTRSCIKVS